MKKKMFWQNLFLNFNFLVFYFQVDAVDGKCVWYGVCHGSKEYCAYDGPPKELDSEGITALRERCSHLLEGNNNKTCCNLQMVSFFFFEYITNFR